MEYAKRLNCVCFADIKSKNIYDFNGEIIDLCAKSVLLRTTYDNLFYGIQVLKEKGSCLLESDKDIKTIEKWFSMGDIKREIFTVKISSIVEKKYGDELLYFLQEKEKVFVKSLHKGFSVVVTSEKILHKDFGFIQFLEEQRQLYGEKLLITEYFQIKKDSIGKRETRHIVMNAELINSSRNVHSIKHSVPKSHLNFAKKTIDYFKGIKGFPQNYVLDIGEFLDDDTFLDIMEINPLSCSMCYVNNSIFTETVSEIEPISNDLKMGYEYCFDFLEHPERYVLNRYSNMNYEYISEKRYIF